MSQYSFDNLRPDKLDARLRNRQMDSCKVTKLTKTENPNKVEGVKHHNALHRSLSTQSAPVRKLSSTSRQPHPNHQHRKVPEDVTRTDSEVKVYSEE